MYKVFFDSLEIFNSKSKEKALKFAINFHCLSKIPHSINVFDPIKDERILTLVRKSYGDV